MQQVRFTAIILRHALFEVMIVLEVRQSVVICMMQGILDHVTHSSDAVNDSWNIFEGKHLTHRPTRFCYLKFLPFAIHKKRQRYIKDVAIPLLLWPLYFVSSREQLWSQCIFLIAHLLCVCFPRAFKNESWIGVQQVDFTAIILRHGHSWGETKYSHLYVENIMTTSDPCQIL